MTLFYQKKILLSLCIYWILFSTSALAAPLPPSPLPSPPPSSHQKSLSPRDSSPALAQLGIDHIEASQVYFSPIQTHVFPPLETHLEQLRLIGRLKPAEPGAIPYFIFTGQTCSQCSEDPSLSLFRPGSNQPTTLSYPGKILDPKTHALLVESRGFYGKCLGRVNETLILFQREKVDRRSRLQSSVLIVEAQEDQLSETFLEKKLPSLSGVLKRVKQKICFEISGRHRVMTTHKIDISPQRASR